MEKRTSLMFAKASTLCSRLGSPLQQLSSWHQALHPKGALCQCHAAIFWVISNSQKSRKSHQKYSAHCSCKSIFRSCIQTNTTIWWQQNANNTCTVIPVLATPTQLLLVKHAGAASLLCFAFTIAAHRSHRRCLHSYAAHQQSRSAGGFLWWWHGGVWLLGFLALLQRATEAVWQHFASVLLLVASFQWCLIFLPIQRRTFCKCNWWSWQKKQNWPPWGRRPHSLHCMHTQLSVSGCSQTILFCPPLHSSTKLDSY